MHDSNQFVYVIFGGAGGIGSSVTKILTNLGHKVIVASRDRNKHLQLNENINVDTRVVDAVNFSEVEACLQNIFEEYGRIDGIVNCIGSILLKPAHLTSEQEWQQTLLTNLGTAFAIVRAATKIVQENSVIVLMSSAAANIGLPNHEAISAAKAGINGLVLSAAATYAGRNIRFNAVAPGLIETKLTEKIVSNPAGRAASIANHPLGRLGKPEDVANLVVWLLDSKNDWITGQIISVDGGLSTLKSRVATK